MLTRGLAALPAAPKPGPVPDVLSLNRDAGLTPGPAGPPAVTVDAPPGLTPLARPMPDDPAKTGLFGRMPPLASPLPPAALGADTAPLMLLLLGSGLMLGPAVSAALLVPAVADPVTLRVWPSST